MKTKASVVLRLFSMTLCLMFAVSGGTAFLSGCSSSSASAKDTKAKKKKKKPQIDEENANDSEESSDDETEDPDSKDEKNKDSEESNKKSSDEGKSEEHGNSAKKSDGEAEKIWKDLIKGNEKFISGKHSNGDFISIRKELSKGQKPEVIVLGCADSRVPPELVFDKNLGELFVVRVAGNIADPAALGSIEYAVEHLHSKVLVILGHESCGAVAAAVSNEEMPTKNLSAIVNKIAPALDGSKSCPLGGKMEMSCVELNIKQSAKDIVLRSPIIKKAVDEGELTIIRAVYKLDTGKVTRQD